MCLELGAEKWIDFKESKDIVQDVKAITGGLGAHSALITATAVSQLVPWGSVCSDPKIVSRALGILKPSNTSETVVR